MIGSCFNRIYPEILKVELVLEDVMIQRMVVFEAIMRLLSVDAAGVTGTGP